MGIRAVVLVTLLFSTSVDGGNKLSIIDAIRKVNPKIAPVKAFVIAQGIYKYSTAHGVDYRLVAALIATESQFKSNALGELGEVGLMQLRPEFFGLHIPRKDRIKQLMVIEENLYYGIKYLAGLKEVFGHRYPNFQWVEFYNRGPNSKPKKFPYARKVISYYKKFGGSLE